jgi:hypothetical protein
VKEFDKIFQMNKDQKLQEPLDVKSVITKNTNSQIVGYDTVNFQIERLFSAPEGPRREYTNVYLIKKEENVLKFSNSAPTLEELLRLNDSTLSRIVSSIKFE